LVGTAGLLITVCIVAADLAKVREELAALQDVELSTEGEGEGDHEEELSSYMAHLQRHTYKMGLAIQSQNRDLAEFYLDEVSEFVEEIINNVPEHDGMEISELARAILLPSVTQTYRVMKEDSWPSIEASYEGIIESCNRCHVSTEHAFIRIVVPESHHGFNQDFHVAETN
jgi:hypothetical protein